MTIPSLDGSQLVRRARAAAGPDGRLPLPDLTAWDIFPFEGDLAVRPLADPVLPEPARQGDDAAACDHCTLPDGDFLWAGARWRVGLSPERYAVPGVLLYPRAHLDLGDLDAAMAAELGVLTVAIERALAEIPGVARVHVNRWGDGGAHLHVWFFARPAGVLQLRGSCLPDWIDVLPPMPEEEWTVIGAHVAHRLATRE